MSFPSVRLVSRRTLLVAATALAVPRRALAAALPATPPQSEGPFYPIELPADVDADLVKVTGADAEALGRVTHVVGRVLDRQSRPVPRALVEIWQCDANGNYLHPRSGGRGPRDPFFQGYGQALTDAGGGYRFRTIRPVPYTGRTPHIHFRVGRDDRELLTTQMYVAGEPRNARDFLFRRLDSEERARVLVELRPADGVEEGALQGTFDLVVEA